VTNYGTTLGSHKAELLTLLLAGNGRVSDHFYNQTRSHNQRQRLDSLERTLVDSINNDNNTQDKRISESGKLMSLVKDRVIAVKEPLSLQVAASIGLLQNSPAAGSSHKCGR